MTNLDLEEQLKKKAARKARPGGGVKWLNIPRNWAHQALTYMDAGELGFRVVVQSLETILVLVLLQVFFPEVDTVYLLVLAFIATHTWNWVTNGLFWAVIIFTFPGLRNPGLHATVDYLNDMKARLADSSCISGLAVYGSVTRGAWHDRSDIDIRMLRRKGFSNLICAGIYTMMERFRAFLMRQPMDLYLADDVDFLKKLRSDEIPVLLLCRDERMAELYPGVIEKELSASDLRSDSPGV